MIDETLLRILVCPVTGAPLEYDQRAGELISKQAGLAFPIRDGIPVMLESEARPLQGQDQKNKSKGKRSPSNA